MFVAYMAKEFHLIKSPGGFAPATDQDAAACNAYKSGELIRVKCQKPRNGKFHRKGFALLQLGFDYWEPRPSLLTAGERSMGALLYNQLLEYHGLEVANLVMSTVQIIEDKRAGQIGEPAKSFEAFRKSVTIKAGFFETVHGTSGIQKVAASLAYDKMQQEDFSSWYKAVFDVLWELVLSRHFESENDVDRVVNQMLEFT